MLRFVQLFSVKNQFSLCRKVTRNADGYMFSLPYELEKDVLLRILMDKF